MLTLRLIVCDEFSEGICMKSHSHMLKVSLISDNLSSDYKEIVLSVCNIKFLPKNVVSFTITIPNNIPDIQGSHRLFIYINNRDYRPSFNSYILPYISDVIQIQTSQKECPQRSRSLLSTFRPFYGPTTSHKLLIIKEEYGLTLGAHIYDCSIILLKYLYNSLSSFTQRRVAVELGAGCGLLSTWLSHHYDTVSCTDMSEQLSLMNENVSLNGSLVNICVSEVDWGNLQQIHELKEKYESTTIDLVIAGDVLYDKQAVIKLFNAIRILSDENTVILVAQKIRGLVSNVNDEDMYKMIGFSAEIVYAEADVIIWRFKLQI